MLRLPFKRLICICIYIFIKCSPVGGPVPCSCSLSMVLLLCPVLLQVDAGSSATAVAMRGFVYQAVAQLSQRLPSYFQVRAKSTEAV